MRPRSWISAACRSAVASGGGQAEAGCRRVHEARDAPRVAEGVAGAQVDNIAHLTQHAVELLLGQLPAGRGLGGEDGLPGRRRVQARQELRCHAAEQARDARS